MRIFVELELDATVYEYDNGEVKLEALRMPGSTHNLMPYLDADALKASQQAAQDKHDADLMAKADEIRERREMAGDIRREMARDDMLASHARAAHAAIFGKSP